MPVKSCKDFALLNKVKKKAVGLRFFRVDMDGVIFHCQMGSEKEEKLTHLYSGINDWGVPKLDFIWRLFTLR